MVLAHPITQSAIHARHLERSSWPCALDPWENRRQKRDDGASHRSARVWIDNVLVIDVF